MANKIDIFYKTYSKDFWLIHISLATLVKNVTGYNNIVILVPELEKHDFETRYLPERTLIHYVKEGSNGYLFQQVCKVNAHKYCDADYILFADSDCLWDHPVNVQDLLVDGKPEILYTPYEQLPDAIIWKEPTEKFIKEPVEFEFMRRLPLVYHRSTLEAIEKYAPNLSETIMKSQRYSEFNILGCYAFKYEKDKYRFINTDEWTYVPPHSIQVWSHSSKDPNTDALHHLEYIRLLEAIMKCFGVPVPNP